MSRFSGSNRPAPILGAADPRLRRPVFDDQTLAEPMKIDGNGKLTVDQGWKGWKETPRRETQWWPVFLMMGA